MSEPTITAEDLTLYALQLLEGEDAAQVELLLKSSSEARDELGRIRGDLALFAMGTEQQTPNPLTRQRLLKQVARERRTVAIPLPIAEQKSRPGVPVYVADPAEITSYAEPAPSRNQSRETEHQERPFAIDTQAVAPDPRSSAALPMRRVEQAPEVYAQRIGREDTLSRTDYGLPKATSKSADSLYDEDEHKDRYVPSSFSFTSFDTPPEEEEKRQGGINKWFAWSGWALAASLAAAGAFALRENFSLRRQVAFGIERVAQADASAAKAELIMQTLQSGSTQRFVLAKTDTPPVPSGRIAYLPERGTLIFQGSNLEPLQPYKTYELWLIPAGEGKQPIPAGTFRPDVRGYASIVLPQMPKGIVAGNFGVTVEDDGGASVPTLPILLIGQQS